MELFSEFIHVTKNLTGSNNVCHCCVYRSAHGLNRTTHKVIEVPVLLDVVLSDRTGHSPAKPSPQFDLTGFDICSRTFQSGVIPHEVPSLPYVEI